MYGDVSPAVVAVQVNALPEVAAGQLTLLVSALPATPAVVVPVAVTALLSLAVLLIE